MYIEKFADRYMDQNTYVVYNDAKEAFVIDPSQVFKQVKEFIEKNGINVKYIILTHGHADHIGDVDTLKELTGAPVVAHKEEADMLEDPKLNLSIRFPGGARSIKPDIFVGEGDKLKIGDETISFFHTPGHSKGGMCVRVGMDMFTGDTLFCREIGRCDLYGGDFDIMLKSLKKLSKMEPNLRVHPGHGPSSTIEEERNYNRYMRSVL